jgi:hypothetical protein
MCNAVLDTKKPPCAADIKVAAHSASRNTQSAAIAQIAAEMERSVERCIKYSYEMSLDLVEVWARQLRAL